MHEGPTNEERLLSPEEKAEMFRNKIEDGINTALQLVAERFEQSPNPKNNLEFHNTRHTGDVIRRFDAIIAAIRAADPSLVDERTHMVGRFAAAHHDTVQDWEPSPVPSKIPGEEGMVSLMRKRKVGDNETASTAGALAIMDKMNEEARAEIFTNEDRAMIAGGHEATIPDFSPEKGVFQPKLNDESSPVERAIALADLGTAGMDGPEKFLPEGDALFREENLDIAEAVKNPESLSSQQKAFFKRRMLGWSKSQITFATKRKGGLEVELGSLPDPVRQEIKKLFDKFDISVEAAQAQAQKRESMSFEELAQSMGYTLGNNTKEVY